MSGHGRRLAVCVCVPFVTKEGHLTPHSMITAVRLNTLDGFERPSEVDRNSSSSTASRLLLGKSEVCGVLGAPWWLNLALAEAILYKYGNVCISLSKVI